MNTQFQCSKAVSRQIGISVSTLSKWRSSGKGPPFYKIEKNGRIKYIMDEVLDWMKRYRYP